MSRFKDIEKIIVDAVVTVDESVPVEYPNFDLADEDKQDFWIKISNVRGPTTPVTVGLGGEDNNDGTIQIDLNYLKNKGSGAILDKADIYATAFTAGKSYTYNGLTVEIMGSSLGGGRYIGGWYRISLNVRYYARTQRNI